MRGEYPTRSRRSATSQLAVRGQLCMVDVLDAVWLVHAEVEGSERMQSAVLLCFNQLAFRCSRRRCVLKLRFCMGLMRHCSAPLSIRLPKQVVCLSFKHNVGTRFETFVRGISAHIIDKRDTMVFLRNASALKVTSVALMLPIAVQKQR